MPRIPTLSLVVSLSLATTADAQLDQTWVRYQKDASALSAGTISDVSNETDLAWGDLDQDGYVDLVVVRKEPFTSVGKRTNVLLMNVGGVLTDRTAAFATAADVPGDQGFLTPTNDRDVVLADFDQDGLLDVVTATTISDGDPKHVGHPRIYRNLGHDVAGWRGLRFEDARIPQLLHFGTGQPENPRFCSVAAGDVTGDEYPDLYFGDYDSSGAGGSQQSGNTDMNDRLLVNDGAGYFTDQSQARMTAQMLDSAFGTSVAIVDLNMDGLGDVLKDTALNAPQYVAASYNDPQNPGTFLAFDAFHTFAPYHMSAGDLNNDGRPDVVVTDDANDRYRLNVSTDPLGRVNWASARTFDFLVGGDDGFGSNNLIADLDGDGWNDVLITDVDVDIGGYDRRLHIYHNRGGTPGTTNLTLREERQSSGGGWVGVVGMQTSDMRGTHDVAVFDVDNDCDNDLVVSRRDGTDVWLNQANPATCDRICQAKVGFGDGQHHLSVCGGDLSSGQDAVMTLEGAPAGSSAIVFAGLAFAPTPVFELNGSLVPVPWLLAVTVPTGSGTVALPVPGGNGPLTLYAQCAVATGATYGLSNAVRIELMP